MISSLYDVPYIVKIIQTSRMVVSKSQGRGQDIICLLYIGLILENENVSQY